MSQEVDAKIDNTAKITSTLDEGIFYQELSIYQGHKEWHDPYS